MRPLIKRLPSSIGITAIFIFSTHLSLFIRYHVTHLVNNVPATAIGNLHLEEFLGKHLYIGEYRRCQRHTRNTVQDTVSAFGLILGVIGHYICLFRCNRCTQPDIGGSSPRNMRTNRQALMHILVQVCIVSVPRSSKQAVIPQYLPIQSCRMTDFYHTFLKL